MGTLAIIYFGVMPLVALYIYLHPDLRHEPVAKSIAVILAWPLMILLALVFVAIGLYEYFKPYFSK